MEKGKRNRLFWKICISAGLILVLIVIFLAAFYTNRTQEQNQGYRSWVEPLSVSVDEYNELSDKKRDRIVDGMNDIAREMLGGEWFERKAVDEYLRKYEGYDSAKSGSAFLAACQMADVDGTMLVYGDISDFDNSGDMLSASVNDFMAREFAVKIGMVDLVNNMMYGTEWLNNPVPSFELTLDVIDLIQQLPEEFQRDQLGSFVICVGDVLGFDGEEVYSDMVQKIQNSI